MRPVPCLLALLLGAMPAAAEKVFTNRTGQTIQLIPGDLSAASQAVEFAIYPRGRDAGGGRRLLGPGPREGEAKTPAAQAPSLQGSFNPADKDLARRLELPPGAAIGFRVPREPMPVWQQHQVQIQIVASGTEEGLHDLDEGPGLWLLDLVTPIPRAIRWRTWAGPHDRPACRGGRKALPVQGPHQPRSGPAPGGTRLLVLWHPVSPKPRCTW